MIPAVRCPRCGDPLEEVHRDTIEGTLCESVEECKGCGYSREWMYGHWSEAEGDGKLIGMYDHLGDYFKVYVAPDTVYDIHLSMTQVVETVKNMNYGEHRFLSELVRQRKADEKYETNAEYRQHTDMLEMLLNEGYY